MRTVVKLGASAQAYVNPCKPLQTTAKTDLQAMLVDLQSGLQDQVAGRLVIAISRQDQILWVYAKLEMGDAGFLVRCWRRHRTALQPGLLCTSVPDIRCHCAALLPAVLSLGTQYRSQTSWLVAD